MSIWGVPSLAASRDYDQRVRPRLEMYREQSLAELRRSLQRRIILLGKYRDLSLELLTSGERGNDPDWEPFLISLPRSESPASDSIGTLLARGRP